MPPVAMPGLPAPITAVISPGAATRVPAPLSTTTQLNFSTSACTAAKRSAWTSSLLKPSSRAASPGCGVRIGLRQAACGCAASKPSPSASRISGLPEPAAASNRVRPHSPRPKPGPHRQHIRALDQYLQRIGVFHRVGHRFRTRRHQRRRRLRCGWRRWPGRRQRAMPLPRKAARRRPCPISPPTQSTWPCSPLCALACRGSEAGREVVAAIERRGRRETPANRFAGKPSRIQLRRRRRRRSPGRCGRPRLRGDEAQGRVGADARAPGADRGRHPARRARRSRTPAECEALMRSIIACATPIDVPRQADAEQAHRPTDRLPATGHRTRGSRRPLRASRWRRAWPSSLRGAPSGGTITCTWHPAALAIRAST